MNEYICKYYKQYKTIVLISILVSVVISLILSKRIGIKTSGMLFVALFCLIINIYLIYKNKKQSIMLFLLLLPIYTTVRRICYFDILFIKVTFETIYITILFISSIKDIRISLLNMFRSKEKLTFKFVFLIGAFFIFCINSGFYSENILSSLSEVYIGVFIPIVFMLCFITYFKRDDKYFVYYILIAAIDFSCLYGIVQLFGRGISPTAIKTNKIYLTFGYNNVNIFAGIVISILPLLVEMILYKKNTKSEKLFLYPSFILYSISIAITFSRGAWFCYIGVIFLSLISKKYRKLLAILIIPAIFVAKPVFHYILDRGTNTSFLHNESAVARIQSIFTDLVIMRKYPFGIGAGNFPDAYKVFSFQGYLSMPQSIRFNAITAHYTLEHAHNLLLQIGVEFGIVAAVIFIIIIINRLKLCLRNIEFNRGVFNSILIYSLFSVITGNQFDHKGVITPTIIIFTMFGITELAFKIKNNIERGLDNGKV
ncbi:O-antigen ligase family protein [Clostridium tyrobutyricum]|mgnify:CR=1 FL=1|uniref:O-antigen ligase family protein n=1 Tax=Clostridium tyrobutyricum TaxID=1519 RepID=UPI0010A9DF3E|nr:O-antigen ligase family protein [Clostridium tyrobutyricum]MBR9649122.1 O-antigen ligase family protein [Clostridium tyrobutyricum]MBV4427820.1 O-antigen ligase family protein [Clostridium tyrobutyricum]MBV4442782.1 O-antigen ligase family protein [Clostridium tyrobutyricum]QCH28049.1 O-Antigen ligase [Clostridium tyrobutyricum]